jgi:hypothetical protein
MLRTLGNPPVFLGMLLGFLLATPVQAYVQAAVARVFGDRPAFRRAFGDRLTMRRVGDLRRVLDPFGAVAALLGGLGWGVTPDVQLRSRGRLAVALLAGPVAVALLGVLAVFGFVVVGGPREVLPGSGPGTLLAGVSGSAAPLFFFGLALELLGMAVLALVPLPPLPGWRLLELASTGSLGWQRAREYLVEKNLGVLALLVLLILPLGGSTPLLLGIVDTVVGSLLNIAA